MSSQQAILVLLSTLTTSPALAQIDVFADPQNLEILPQDISSKDLSATMRGFAMGLGVRCETCHVGESGQPLSTFDFASDEKPMKHKARVMLRMMTAINAEHVTALNDIEEAQRVEVRCVTCHRGRPQPKLIEDVLNEQLAEGGTEAAIAEYKMLRAEFYGSHSYDFSEFSLPMYAQSLFGRGEGDAALAFFRRAVDADPTYARAYVCASWYYRRQVQLKGMVLSDEEKAEALRLAQAGLDADRTDPYVLWQAGMTRADFLPAASNQAALEAFADWQEWPGGRMLSVGPPGSGRSHLLHIWATETRARAVASDTLLENRFRPDGTETGFVVDDGQHLL